MKICKKCLVKKNIDDFHVKRSSNGISYICGTCKNCKRIDQAKWKSENPDKVKKNAAIYREKNRQKLRDKNKDYYQTIKEDLKANVNERIKKRNEWLKRNPNYTKDMYIKRLDKIKDRNSLYRRNNKEKNRSRRIFRTAVEKGELQRPSECSICNKVCKTEGHHHDYSKPLDVIWVCKSCHARTHAREKGSKIEFLLNIE